MEIDTYGIMAHGYSHRIYGYVYTITPSILILGLCLWIVVVVGCISIPNYHTCLDTFFTHFASWSVLVKLKEKHENFVQQAKFVYFNQHISSLVRVLYCTHLPPLTHHTLTPHTHTPHTHTPHSHFILIHTCPLLQILSSKWQRY